MYFLFRPYKPGIQPRMRVTKPPQVIKSYWILFQTLNCAASLHLVPLSFSSLQACPRRIWHRKTHASDWQSLYSCAAAFHLPYFHSFPCLFACSRFFLPNSPSVECIKTWISWSSFEHHCELLPELFSYSAYFPFLFPSIYLLTMHLEPNKPLVHRRETCTSYWGCEHHCEIRIVLFSFILVTFPFLYSSLYASTSLSGTEIAFCANEEAPAAPKL